MLSVSPRVSVAAGVLLLAALGGVGHAASQAQGSAVVKPTSSRAASEAQATVALNQALAKLNSLEANFSQTTQTTAAKPLQKNPQALRSSHLNQNFTGLMQVKRAGNFRWETQSPMQQLIVTNGRTVWIYDPDLEQATRQQLDEQISNTPALLLSGQTDAIKKSFQVTQPDRNTPYFVLYPRSKEGVFESLAIRFNGDVPSQMILKDALGQQTTVTFSNTKLNINLSNELCACVPPNGTDVIDQ